MELRQLQYFLLVAQELNFAKASKKAFVSQQALSKSVLTLEKEMGIPLFERLPHGVALTPYGQVFLNKANHIVTELNNTVSDIHAMKMNTENTIHVAVTTGVDNCLSVKDLINFQVLNPKYRISTISNNDSIIEKWLFSEKYELGILGAQGDLSKLDFIPLLESKTLLAIHKDNPLSSRSTLRLEELSEESFVFGSSDYYVNNRLFSLCNLLGFTPKISHSTTNILYIAQLVAYNQGIFLCPDNSVKYFNHPDIRLIPFEFDPSIFCMYLVTKKNHSLSKGAQLFRDFILDKNNRTL